MAEIYVLPSPPMIQISPMREWAMEFGRAIASGRSTGRVHCIQVGQKSEAER
jgi:hypothetical protein